MDSHPFHLMTYNIHKGFSSGNRYHTADAIKEALLKIQPDVICFQEMQGEHHPKRFKHQQRPQQGDLGLLLDQHYWSHHCYAKNAEYPGGHHGNAVFSHAPITFSENINLSRLNRASRSLLHVAVIPEAWQSPIHVICVHLGLLAKNRHEQMTTLCERVKQHVPDGEPLIIAGDFNDWRHRARHLLQQTLGLQEAHDVHFGRYARTFPAKRPLLATDRIYYRGLICEQASVLRGTPWIHLSDHLPLMATFSRQLR